MYGIKDFYLSVNFMKEVLKTYLNLYHKDKKLSFIEEKVPRGTAGCLSSLKK